MRALWRPNESGWTCAIRTVFFCWETVEMKSIGKHLGRLLRFIDDKCGVSTVEYALIVVAVIGVVGVGAASLSGAFDTLFTNLTTEIAGASEAVSDAASGAPAAAPAATPG